MTFDEWWEPNEYRAQWAGPNKVKELTEEAWKAALKSLSDKIEYDMTLDDVMTQIERLMP